MPRDSAERMRADIGAAEEIGWSLPDMGVLRLYRRPPPPECIAMPWEEPADAEAQSSRPIAAESGATA